MYEVELTLHKHVQAEYDKLDEKYDQKIESIRVRLLSHEIPSVQCFWGHFAFVHKIYLAVMISDAVSPQKYLNVWKSK